MIKSTFTDIKIAAIGVAVPTKWTPVEEFLDDADPKGIAKFKKNTGVEGRYDSGIMQTTSDLCCAAGKKAIKHANIDPKDIGLLVFVTQTPDYKMPATACVLQYRLAMSEDCMAFDVNQGCAGLVYGMNIVCGIMESANINNALLLVGDTSGKSQRRFIKDGLKAADNNEAKLFGDAGAAILLKKESNAPRLDMAMRTEGKGFKAIIDFGSAERHYYTPSCSEMDGIEVFNFAIEKPPALIKEVMDLAGREPADYDCLILHQANKMIMKQIARRAGFTSAQNLTSIDEFGNTSSASIATVLVKHFAEENEGKINAMLCGFGIGMSWGAVSAEIEKCNILPLIRTDEYFDDGYDESVYVH